MYTNFKLSSNPSFKMLSGEFNELCNSIKAKPDKRTKQEVRIAYTIRTVSGNLVETSPKYYKEFILDPSKGEGMFCILSCLQLELLNRFPNLCSDDIAHTVLLPIGAFEENNILYIYFNVILDDKGVENFKTKGSLVLEPIEPILNNSDLKDIIVLPTLTLTKN